MIYTKVRDVKDPTGNRDEDNGLDFYVPNDWNNGKPYILRMNEQVNIPSGIKVKVEKNKTFRIENKSGVSVKKGLVRGASVIDPGYRGEIHLNLFKVVKGSQDIKVRYPGILGFIGMLFGIKTYATVINPGEKITQGIIENVSSEALKYVKPEQYEKGPKTKRQSGSFGSTGTK